MSMDLPEFQACVTAYRNWFQEILIGAGENGICLPFMSQSTTACVLTQAAG